MKPTLYRGLTFSLKLLVFGVLLSGCKTVQDAAQKLVERDGDTKRVFAQLNPKYEPSKLAVGLDRDLMNKRADSYGLISVPEINNYLNGVRSRLVRASEVSGVPGKIYVTADPQLEGTTTPDGNSFVSWNLLKYMSSEDDVAALIAHELAHSLLGHCNSSAYGQYIQRTRWLHRFGMEIVLDTRNSSTNIQQKGLKKGEVSQLNNLQLAATLATKVVSPSWQRTQERSADLLGVDLMIAAGYNPDGMINMLSIIKQYDDNNRKGPDWDKLGKNLMSLSQGDTRLKLQGGVGVVEMLWGHDHPDAVSRTADIQDYLARQYDDSELINSYQRSGWEKARRNPVFRKLLAAYEGALDAQKLLEEGKSDEAYRKSQSTIGQVRNQAYPAFIYAWALDAAGKPKEAQVALKLALDNHQEGSGKVYNKFAAMLSSNGKHKDAYQVMSIGYERFGKAPQLVPGMVRYQRLSGDRKQASETARMCALNYPDYSDVCAEEANRT